MGSVNAGLEARLRSVAKSLDKNLPEPSGALGVITDLQDLENPPAYAWAKPCAHAGDIIGYGRTR